jgi:chemotaxis protein MotA
MDIATLLGLLGAFGIVIMAMVLGGGVLVFVNVPSMLVVIGGTTMVVMMKFTLGQYIGAVKIAIKAFLFKSTSIDDLIEKSVALADAARKGGLLSLESFQTDNELLKKGIQLLVDGHDSEVVKKMLTKEMLLTVERHMNGQKIFSAIGDVAPAMGMIGTLVGLVQMLSAMDDPKSIGPAMAVALLTTLYGAMIATMVALPIADKLSLRSDEERRTRSLVIDALGAVQAGQNPRVIADLLKSYLPSSKRGGEEEE